MTSLKRALCSVFAVTGSAALQPPARQTSPGPISLELFGVEETEDAPLDLPVQAAITVLPTVASSIDRSTTDAQSTLGGALGMQQSCLYLVSCVSAACML